MAGNPIVSLLSDAAKAALKRRQDLAIKKGIEEAVAKAGDWAVRRGASSVARLPAAGAAARAGPSPQLQQYISPLTYDVFHGTRRSFPAFADRNIQTDSNPGLSLRLGVHAAPDARVASAPIFVGEAPDQGGRVMPLKTQPPERFLEVDQPLNPLAVRQALLRGGDAPPRGPKTVDPDDPSVGRAILEHAYRKDPQLLDYTLSMQLGSHYDRTPDMAARLLGGEPVSLHNLDGQPPVQYAGLSDFLRNFNPLVPYDRSVRESAVNSYRGALRDQGYSGLKYINTNPSEVGNEVSGATVLTHLGVPADEQEALWNRLHQFDRTRMISEHRAKNKLDPTSYIIFPQVDATGHFPIRSRFAAFDPALKEEPELGFARGGRVSSLAVRR
jgi:hypothetical protein